MKQHLILSLARRLSGEIPYWEDFIYDKSQSLEHVLPEVDGVLRSHPFWVTGNYRPAKKNWSKQEVESGLDREYRIILRENGVLPDSIVERIRLLPYVREIRSGGITETVLPRENIVKATSLRHRYRQDSTLMRAAHQFTSGDDGVVIAVLDTGFEAGHQEIAHALLPGKDFVDIIDGATNFIGDFLGYDDIPEDEVGHGTHVAGIICGAGRKMPVGVAPRCRILPVKVLGALRQGAQVVGAGLIDNINSGIKYAVDAGADVINMSLGIRHLGGGLPHEKVIRYALSKGVTVVAASGNDGREDRYYPGAIPGVIAVGAADNAGLIAPFSTYGTHVSLTAPGVNILSSHLNGKYAFSSGTSQAAPFVAGAIGLLKSLAAELGGRCSHQELKTILRHTSHKAPGKFKDQRAGYGHLNILDALKMLRHLN